MTLKDYVNFKLTHADKTAEAEGYPLVMENCKVNKKMKQLLIYGNGDGVGDLTSDGKHNIPIVIRGVNLFDSDTWNAKAETINGITFTPLDNERIHIKGKAENTSSAVNYQKLIKANQRVLIKKGFYRGKPCKYSSASGFTFMFGISNGKSAVNINTRFSGAEVTFDNAYINFVQFHLSGNALNVEYDDVIDIQFMSGTEDLPFEPYVEPVTTNVFLNEPLQKRGNYVDYLDFTFKEACHYNAEGSPYLYEDLDITMPRVVAKTTIIEVDTTISPSNVRGKYIKN